jgi:hypothetical protein
MGTCADDALLKYVLAFDVRIVSCGSAREAKPARDAASLGNLRAEQDKVERHIRRN